MEKHIAGEGTGRSLLCRTVLCSTGEGRGGANGAIILETPFWCRITVVKLPNHASAVVPREKIVDYLLSVTHCEGRGKALFFAQF